MREQDGTGYLHSSPAGSTRTDNVRDGVCTGQARRAEKLPGAAGSHMVLLKVLDREDVPEGAGKIVGCHQQQATDLALGRQRAVLAEAARAAVASLCQLVVAVNGAER